jgi:hypothetical protein
VTLGVAVGVAVTDGMPGVGDGVALAGVRLKGSLYKDEPGSKGLSRLRGRSSQKYLISACRLAAANSMNTNEAPRNRLNAIPASREP